MENPFTGKQVRLPADAAADIKKQLDEINSLSSLAKIQSLSGSLTSPPVHAEIPVAPAASLRAHHKPRRSHKSTGEGHGHGHGKLTDRVAADTASLGALSAAMDNSAAGLDGIKGELSGLLAALPKGLVDGVDLK